MRITQFWITIMLSLILSSQTAVANKKYPAKWWEPVPESEAASWEILPQAAKKGEVILSKRNELGQFSNFAKAPINFEDEHYDSIEGLWQMMHFPDPELKNDARNKLEGYPFTRAQIKLMNSFPCKRAGSTAKKLNKANGINWISYKGKKFNHWDMAEGSKFHYDLIFRAMEQKILQNPKLKVLLLQTGDLKLLPDHTTPAVVPPSYRYNDMLMKIRIKLQKKQI